MCAATTIDEVGEAARTRQFLLDMDPSNHFGLEHLE
jgi:hypothetical protein